jgi:hypothetical protein
MPSNRSLKDYDWGLLFSVLDAMRGTACLQCQLKDLVPPAPSAISRKLFSEKSARNVRTDRRICRLIISVRRRRHRSHSFTKVQYFRLFAYDDLALRRFVDLDVIVRKHDVARARDLLLADDYAPLRKPLTLEQQELLLRTQHNFSSRKTNRA